MRRKDSTRPLRRFASGIHRSLLALALGQLLCLGCTQVKFIQKNPYTGEIWTVYGHFAGSDTLTYCPPIEGAGCVDAQLVEGSPPPPPPDAPPPVATPQ